MKKLTVAVTPEIMLVIYRKDRESEIKHSGNEFG